MNENVKLFLLGVIAAAAIIGFANQVYTDYLAEQSVREARAPIKLEDGKSVPQNDRGRFVSEAGAAERKSTVSYGRPADKKDTENCDQYYAKAKEFVNKAELYRDWRYATFSTAFNLTYQNCVARNGR